MVSGERNVARHWQLSPRYSFHHVECQGRLRSWSVVVLERASNLQIGLPFCCTSLGLLLSVALATAGPCQSSHRLRFRIQLSQMQSYFFIASLVSFDVGPILDIFSNESQLSSNLFMVDVNGVVVCSPRFNFVCLPEPSTANDDVFSFIGSMSALR